MTQELCTHVMCSNEHPVDAGDHYENLVLLVSAAKGLFELIAAASQTQQIPGDVAYLGRDLCKELDRRAAALYKCVTSKEG